ncbi:glyceraldehyde-3-phosphate dehydrogenase [Tritonibacter horizontis]|uniref:Glyceraldehyde-3-phosphate dehydrogenase n=1 Tax=Tritonibacter horizontis TaxID=1768241 RepID=A0A132BRN6_9RHOB|nr:glyceraldehyde-3-phosphate dehydrogenase [Tritonibacter horizontis]KUP90876.1 hypothetical protein TRIHO_42320 [Tritonibacter horizontis]
MSNSLAITLGLLLLACIAIDVIFFGTQNLVFLGKKLFLLIEWMAFWR